MKCNSIFYMFLLCIYVFLQSCAPKLPIIEHRNTPTSDEHILIQKYKHVMSKYMVDENYRLYEKEFDFSIVQEMIFPKDSIVLVSLRANEEISFKFWGILTNDECLLFYFDGGFDRIPRKLPLNVKKYEEILLGYLKKNCDADPDEIIIIPNKP